MLAKSQANGLGNGKNKTVKEKLKAWGVKDAKLTKEGRALVVDVLKELRDTARGKP